ncbi:MAG: FHA domain-containing protein [Bacteroidetes bacterium]|nr:MAG: FHA domain-containing protein [Bacteroidota bacterium]TAG89592.1 MAG: FHA domain-containing protein [Bacteroidota bacterium]
MSDFRLCDNGHYFPQTLENCPYCPKPTSKGGSGQTALGNKNNDESGTQGNLARTQIFGGNQPKDDGGFPNLNIPKSQGGGGGGNLNRTQIFSGNNSFPDFGGGFASPQQFQPELGSQGRKMVGWLVSFTIDALGIDYKLYEGRNLIGSDDGCDIPVNDDAVSSRHLTILHRMGQFKFKDEFSTNGTFINDVFMEEGNLKDGDMIRIGDTIFKFRSIA